MSALNQAKAKISCLILFLLFFQLSCGFTPAYKMNKGDGQILASVEVSPIETIEGVDFYNHIKSIFPLEKNSNYILNTTLSFTRSYNIIQPNSDILRETQNIHVNYQLVDKHSLKILTKGNFTKISSYSVNFSLYSNTTLRQETMANLAENAAEEIRNRLLLFFAGNSYLR